MTSGPTAVGDEPSRDVLHANRLRLVLDLAARMRAFEEQYGFASLSLQTELASGRIVETAEIADWLTAFKTLAAVLGSGPAPAE